MDIATYQKSSTTKQSNLMAAKLIDWMAKIYPSMRVLLEKSNNTQVNITAWTIAIRDLTTQQINCGRSWLLKQGTEFAPSPARFRYKAFGLLDSEAAFTSAKKGNLTSPAIYHAYHGVGSQNWRKQTDERLWQMFKREYAYFCDKILRGEELQMPQNVLELTDDQGFKSFGDFKNHIAKQYGKECAEKFCQEGQVSDNPSADLVALAQKLQKRAA